MVVVLVAAAGAALSAAGLSSAVAYKLETAKVKPISPVAIILLVVRRMDLNLPLNRIYVLLIKVKLA